MSLIPSNTRITPFLWFDGNADEAVNFYLSVFKNSRRLDKLDSAVDSSVPKGKTITISFELDGQAFVALNGGPNFKFTEAISFMIRCENQEEIDYYWSKLTADGGAEVQCGWLKDKFRIVVAGCAVANRAAHFDSERDASDDEDEKARHRGVGKGERVFKERCGRGVMFVAASRDLFVAQCDHRIDAHCAARWNVAGGQRDCGEQQRRENKRRGVGGSYFEKQSRHDASRRDSSDDANCNSSEASFAPSPRTSFNTSARCAPSAM